MISSTQSKLIRSLRQKKFRDQHKLYVAEGEKMVHELTSGQTNMGHRVKEIFATAGWIRRNEELAEQAGCTITEASPEAIKKVSNLVAPQQVIALVSIPREERNATILRHVPVLAFEDIRDPGNLGTILRTADWFGIRHVVCTQESVDLFNPKVVQATMGAIARVHVQYLPLEELLHLPELVSKPVYGTFLRGENIYDFSFAPDPVILFGNESHGLSDHYHQVITHNITIPSFSDSNHGSESLNVAASVAVVCSEFRRRL